MKTTTNVTGERMENTGTYPKTLHLMRGMSLVDAVNRVYLSTGSARNAMIGADADYNGHHVMVWRNPTHHTWTAYYTWAGLNYLIRGADFETAVRVGKAEFDRGARGASVAVAIEDAAQEAHARSLGFQSEEEIAAAAGPVDPRFAEVTWAIWNERHFGVPAVSFLLNSATVEEYKAKLNAAFAARRKTA